MEPEPSILESFHLRRGKFIIYVGRLVPEKRVEDLIQAFLQLRTKHRLAIVGEGGYTDGYVNELLRVAGGEPRIVFTGLQRGNALETLYRGAAAFVLPSDLEGLPMSLLEATERGIPAVVSDIPPHREILGSVNGYDLFVPCRDVNGLTQKMGQVLECHDYYTEVASRARAFVRECYSWDSSVDETEKVFHRVIYDMRHGTVTSAARVGRTSFEA
jgi:glycosyltransferase involved in cell wall biosynthesis